jgi:hypothetical protein
MKLKVEYSMNTHIGMNPELDDKMRVFFGALGFRHVGSGSGLGIRDLQFEREDKVEECHGGSLPEGGEVSQ